MKIFNYNAIDLFSGCGGQTQGLHQAGFTTKVAIEKLEDAVSAFKLNHENTEVILKDIRLVSVEEILEKLNGETLHLLAGCPPCQGFSSIRRLNRNNNVQDDRNDLIFEYLRLVEKLMPLTLMMENVPGIINYDPFKGIVLKLKELGYNIKIEVVNVKDYGVPQKRKRMIMVGSLLGDISVASPTGEKVTVKDVIGNLEPIETTKDSLHKVVASHTTKVMERIKLTPKNGGSWKDLPIEFKLKCHTAENVGFNDVYGRLRWDDYSTTITGGCLNPSKGRFLHPEENRCITAREAALLQSFPPNYQFPTTISKTSIALLIGNALPPKFSYYQSKNIKEHLDKYLGTN